MLRLHCYGLTIAGAVLFGNCVVWGEDSKPTPTAATPAEINRLIKQLGSEKFDEREAASKALEAIGGSAYDALNKAASESSDAEMRKRAEKLLEPMRAKAYGEQRRFSHPEPVGSVAFSPDGKRALSGCADKMVRLWDLETGKELRCFRGHSMGISVLAFSADGKRALSGSGDKTMRLWDVESGKELGCFRGHTKCLECVVFSSDGKRALSSSEDQTMRLWDLQTGQELQCFKGHTKAIESVAFSPDGKRVLSGSIDKTVRLWDVETGKELRRFNGNEGDVARVAFSLDGKQVLSAGWDETVRWWDGDTGKELRCIKCEEFSTVYSADFSADRKWALLGSKWPTVRLVDLESGKVVHLFEGHTSSVSSVVFSPDGKRALSASIDQTVRLWRLAPEPGNPANRIKDAAPPKGK